MTCIFIDRRHRRKHLSAVALQGVLDLIAAAGGGTVEGYPHDKAGTREAVLYGTRTLFEAAGFDYVRAKGPSTASCAGPCPEAQQPVRDQRVSSASSTRRSNLVGLRIA